MFCDVYFLRRRGEKLPPDRLPGMRGHVRLDGCMTPEGRSYTALLTDGRPSPYPGACITRLLSARLTRMDHRGFILTGIELGDYSEQYPSWPQAWFCVPVSARPGADEASMPGPAVGGGDLARLDDTQHLAEGR